MEQRIYIGELAVRLDRGRGAVEWEGLLPGDLIALYWPVSHIGIYIGNGRYIHASTAIAPPIAPPYHTSPEPEKMLLSRWCLTSS